MAEGGAPPPEAMRGGVGGAIVTVIVVVVAVLAFVAGGFVLGPILIPPEAPLAELIIGTNTPFPPFEFKDDADNIVGFDISLISEIMNRTGRSFRVISNPDFSALLLAVQQGEIDIVASAVTSSGSVGAARNTTMDFSDVYFEADQSVLIRAGTSPVSCAASGCVPADFAGIDIATQSGTTSEFWVLDFVTGASPPIAGATLTTFPDVALVLVALQAGQVDVVIIDKPAGEGIAAANPQFASTGTIETDELYAFAVDDGDPLDLLPGINRALADMMADGTFDEIIAVWF